MKKVFLFAVLLFFTAMIGYPAAQSDTSRVIAFGTLLKPQVQIAASQQLAISLANPNGPQWRARGDQKRTYRFAEANATVAYRVCVPKNWDGNSKLPLVMFLHGAGNDESSYLNQNDSQMVKLAMQHGFLLVSPLGYNGAYGTFIRLPAVFNQQAEADKFIAAITPESERTNELSEKDVINVLELVLYEYPIDRASMFLTGHSMGSGGTWYIGGKYPSYWNALAPMSGPFVMEKGYPWDSLRRMPVFVTEGLQAASVAGSRALRDWMNLNGFKLKYKEVNADHPGMVPIVLPEVFNFFDSCRKNTVAVSEKQILPAGYRAIAIVRTAAGYRITLPTQEPGRLELLTLRGRILKSLVIPGGGGEILLRKPSRETGLLLVLLTQAGVSWTAPLCTTN